ncbi:MAG: hypothetical protein EOP00_05245 [Pedobacter sp.]|nr:MAG: hypothetical protein EOP00_05245 [Pedobacter sp.]
MKTSNKILIAFAAALLLIPILGMVYVSQVEYKEGKYVTDVVYKNDHFKDQVPNMVSTPITKSFNAVNIKDGKGYFINIRLVEDKDYGVKVQGKSIESFKFEVDELGVLQITLADKSEDSHYYGRVIVYAPNIKLLSIATADGVELNAKQDSLSLNVSNSGNVNFSSASEINKVAVTASNVKTINVEKDIQNLVLNLTNTPFYSNYASFDNLNIATNSTIELTAADSEKEKYSIKNLVVNTTGEASLKIENIKVLKCSGNFSDQTKVEMPAAYLNQMFKK